MTEKEAVELLKKEPMFIKLSKNFKGYVNFMTGEGIRYFEQVRPGYTANPSVMKSVIKESALEL